MMLSKPSWPSRPVGDFCRDVSTVDPSRNPALEIAYIDIASIDRVLKTITEPQKLLGADAPSRARQLVRADDVLVSTVRPNLNAVAIVPPELDQQVASTGFCVLRADREKLNPRLIYYWVQTPEFVQGLLERVRGANYPAVRDTDVLTSGICFPDNRHEQARIVELLEQADALRRLRSEADAKLSRFLSALFRHHFGDLNRNVQSWEPTTFGDLAEIATSLVEPTDELLDLPHIGADRIEKDSGRLLPASSAREDGISSGKFLFDERDVLYCKIRPYLRKVALPTFRGLCSADIYPLRPKSRRSTREFLWQLLLSEHFTAYTATVATRANMPKINQDQLFAYKTVQPPFEEQLAFSERARAAIDLHSKAITSAAKLEALFQTLLHRAFTGELTAKWREAHLREGVQEMIRIGR